MVGLVKRVQKKFKASVESNKSAALDTLAEVIRPSWFIDRATGNTLPTLDKANKLKKFVMVDGNPCPTEYASALLNALKMISSISTVRKDSKKEKWPKLMFSHAYYAPPRMYDKIKEKHHVLELHGSISLEARNYKILSEKDPDGQGEYIGPKRLIDIGCKSRYAGECVVNVIINVEGKDMLEIIVDKDIWSSSTLWSGEANGEPILFDDIMEKYMKC